MSADREPDGYVIEHVRAALAEDARVGVLDVEVTVAGDKVFLTGDAGTAERRTAASEVVAELLPDHEIHNEMSLADVAGAVTPEELT